MMNKAFWVVQTSPIQSVFRILLGVFLGLAGIGHLSVLRQEFLAQVPNWLPIDGDLVVVLSGVVENSSGGRIDYSTWHVSSDNWLGYRGLFCTNLSWQYLAIRKSD